MKRFSLILAASLMLCLSACKTDDTFVGPGVVSVQVPNLPATLSTRAEALPPITDATMGGMVLDGVAADRQYNDVAWQLNNLIVFYNCIQSSINNKTDTEECLTNDE